MSRDAFRSWALLGCFRPLLHSKFDSGKVYLVQFDEDQEVEAAVVETPLFTGCIEQSRCINVESR